MRETKVDVKTKDGTMPTFTVCPDSGGPFPAILFYMDAPAIREELYDMARRIAKEGYYVILPDLFYRFGTIRFPFRDANTRLIWRTIMDNLSNAMVMDDTRTMLDYLAARPDVRPGPKGCIGYCMSGRFVTAAAGTFPDEIAAAASLYGVAVVTGRDDSAHKQVKNIKGEIYFGFAETDSTVPDYVVPTLKGELDRHGIAHVLEVIPGTEHGFCFPERECYNEKEAERVWHLFMDMCRRRVRDAA